MARVVLAAVLAAPAQATAQLAVQDAINPDATPYANAYPGPWSMYMHYTPFESYWLAAIHGHYGFVGGPTKVRPMGILDYYLDWGGTELSGATTLTMIDGSWGEHGSFAWWAHTFDTPVWVESGTTYYIGYNPDNTVVPFTRDPGAHRIRECWVPPPSVGVDPETYCQEVAPILRFLATTATVPEPTGLVLIATGLLGVFFHRRRQSRLSIKSADRPIAGHVRCPNGDLDLTPHSN